MTLANEKVEFVRAWRADVPLWDAQCNRCGWPIYRLGDDGKWFHVIESKIRLGSPTSGAESVYRKCVVFLAFSDRKYELTQIASWGSPSCEPNTLAWPPSYWEAIELCRSDEEADVLTEKYAILLEKWRQERVNRMKGNSRRNW